jgi:hypothetical protein
MITTSFLNKLAQKLAQDFPETLSELIIILPNKRAKVFLLEALKKAINQTIIAPEIKSIEEFIEEVATVRPVDTITVLFEFYQVYTAIEQDKKEPFDEFATWAKTLLQDFNEIDRYLIDPNKILKYLENIKEIEHWSVDATQKTPLIESYLLFWKKLPNYYHQLYQHLLQKGIGYQGLLYREADRNAASYIASISNQHFVFAGFNALNKAEERIFQQLLEQGCASVYWDIDEVFLNDPLHDAGLFQRRYIKNWPYYKKNPYQWIATDFKLEKQIHIIGTSKLVGQAKIVGKIIEDTIASENIENTAIILGEENVLLPVLYALPNTLETLNITMGFSSKNNPAQLLISKWFKLHTAAINRDEKNYVFYFKEVLDILTHPLIEQYLNCSKLIDIINQNNYSFISHKKLFELQGEPNEFFSLLLDKWEDNALQVLQRISKVLLLLKEELDHSKEEEKITKTFIYSLFALLNRIQSYFIAQDVVSDVKTLYAIYKQLLDVAEVSFEGEPLSGLQIMGVLESRVLDFETVIITSVNEGKFPAGKSLHSFIPYDVKLEYELPTYKEKDAIYTYHFYHLLQRAKTVYLLYNSDSEGFDAGEKSRFITQLEIEKQKAHQLIFESYTALVPNIAGTVIEIPKSEKVMERLQAINEKGFSPSSLTTYIRNPIQFYFQRILKVVEIEEVEESIEANTLGTIIHKTLEQLYLPYVGKQLTIKDVEEAQQKITNEVSQQFKAVYKEGDIQKGRNLLAFEVAKRNVENFLKIELEQLQNQDEVFILALEKSMDTLIEHANLPYPIKISGQIDRIEIRNNTHRIIDYKTGKVEQKHLQISTWNGLTRDVKNEKIIQILCYALMYQKEVSDKPIEAGIISFKNRKAGFMPFSFKADKTTSTTIDNKTLVQFTEELVLLLAELHNPTLSFIEKEG